MEDTFIERQVESEANYLISAFNNTGQWPASRMSHMTLYFSENDFPDDLKSQYIQTPKRSEFYGKEGRHYHLYTFPNQKSTFLVAEVSNQLIVRPIKDWVIKFFLICGVALTIIAFVIAWLLGRKTAVPLKKLADLVDGVKPENIPNKFADKYPNNEIGILARTLESSMQQINDALAREKCFTRDASHELRTPVAIIKNAVEVYREKNPTESNNSGLIERISEAAMQMEQTVTTLLVLAREEHTSAKKTSTQLLPLIENSILDHSYLLNEKDVEVSVSDKCNAHVLAQQGMLKVLLDNIISNAFQYTNLGEVNIDFTDNTLIISDTGPGIEKDISENITDASIKGSQSTGYGFGLSIVKRLCEHQNWQLSVSSNTGTKISISF